MAFVQYTDPRTGKTSSVNEKYAAKFEADNPGMVSYNPNMGKTTSQIQKSIGYDAPSYAKEVEKKKTSSKSSATDYGTVKPETSDFALTDADYGSVDSNFTGSTTRYIDPEGNEQTGYIIDDLTYADQEGQQRVGVGSKVETAGGWYELTPDGGVKIDDPFADMIGIDPGSSYVDPTTLPVVGTTPVIDVPGSTTVTEEPYAIDESYFTPYEQTLYDQSAQLLEQVMDYEPTETMSRDEAQARAQAQLRMPYQEALEDTMTQYDQDAIARGMFGQLPTETAKREAMARVELAEQSAVNDLANDLFVQDFEMGQAVDSSNIERMVNMINLNAAQLAQETGRKQEAMGYEAAEKASESAAYDAAVESAYKRWEALGAADGVVSEILGIPEGTLSSDNMELQMEYQFKSKLAEYENILALEKAAQEYGFDISLAGYKSNLDLQEAAQKLQYDLIKAGNAAEIDYKKFMAELEAEYGAKIAFEKFKNELISPDLRVDLFNQAVDLTEVDQDKKDFVYNYFTNDLANAMQFDENGELLVPGDPGYVETPFDETLKDIDSYLGEATMSEIMDTYNGLVNIALGGGDSGLNLDDYLIDETETEPTAPSGGSGGSSVFGFEQY